MLKMHLTFFSVMVHYDCSSSSLTLLFCILYPLYFSVILVTEGRKIYLPQNPRIELSQKRDLIVFGCSWKSTLKCILEICPAKQNNSHDGLPPQPKVSTHSFLLLQKLDHSSGLGVSSLSSVERWHLTALLHKLPSLLGWWLCQKEWSS